MLTVRRAVAAVALVLIAVGAYAAWQVWRVERELSTAQTDAERLVQATRDQDAQARTEALSDFVLTAASARDRTNGPLWSGLTKLPLVGDDLTGVRALSSSLHTVATGGVQPLIDVVDSLDGIASDGRVDVARVQGLREPVSSARSAFRAGFETVADEDSSGYAGPLRQRFDQYVAEVEQLSRALGSAERATQVLPGFLGADGPRTFLLVFQNNAEIRSTGGIPGSWAEMHAEDGRLEIVRQGTAGEFGRRDTPVLPLTDGELQVYSDLLGVYFQDATFTPDFPRAASLMAARWEERYPGESLDGVVSLDPVALSYLLDGTGPVVAGGVTLDSANAVEQLLNRPYLELDTDAQDTFFASAVQGLFRAVTSDLRSPLDFVRGLERATDEKRFYVAAFDPQEAAELDGTAVVGAFPDDDGTHPRVYAGLNDATGSKMSYYLRYQMDVQAQSCKDHIQTLSGTMSLSQTIASAAAQQLPESVTGTGDFGTERGSQLVAVRLYGPVGGSVSDIKVDGRAVDVPSVELDGRPVVTLVALLSGPDDVLVSWSMDTAPGQVGSGSYSASPGVADGGKDYTFGSAC